MKKESGLLNYKKRMPSATIQKAGLSALIFNSCSKDSFVLTGKFVLLINVCEDSLALRLADNRNGQAYNKRRQRKQKVKLFL
jgi:hypothetical protein